MNCLFMLCLDLSNCKTTYLDKESSMASGGRRKSSILVDRKLSVDFARKLSAISVASDVSLISDRFGLDQGELKNIVQDILEMNVNDDFDVSHEIIKVSRHDVTLLQLGSEDGMSEYGDTEEPGLSIWQELQNETIRLDSRKSSSSSQVAMSCQWQIKKNVEYLQASTDSLDSAEDFKPVEINLGEIREMLAMYINKRKVSNTLPASKH